uniref:Uncharacterized protein n=1 Tax=Caenorhabditis japonica TaxID=281687 RepID=A0A8R1IAK9_CAEJA
MSTQQRAQLEILGLARSPVQFSSLFSSRLVCPTRSVCLSALGERCASLVCSRHAPVVLCSPSLISIWVGYGRVRLRRGSTTILDTVTTLGSDYADLCKLSLVFSQVPCGERRSLWALYLSRVSPFGVTLVGVPVSCRLSLAATSAISTTDIDRIEGPLCTWIRWPGSLVGSLGWRIRGRLSPLFLDPCAHGFVGLARSLARLAGGFVARCPRWFWIRRDVVGRADVPRRAPCDWQDSCSCFWMDSCRASCSLVEDFCPVAELITSES